MYRHVQVPRALPPPGYDCTRTRTHSMHTHVHTCTHRTSAVRGGAEMLLAVAGEWGQRERGRGEEGREEQQQ
eukprot:2570586-Rhodomonas_salina.3